MNPDATLQTLPEFPGEAIPQEIDRLWQLAIASRPELQGRLAAIARDQKAVELARKRYYPNVTVGVVYQDMEKTNAMTPGRPRASPTSGCLSV